MAVARLRYWVLIVHLLLGLLAVDCFFFSGMKSERFQLSTKRKKRRTRQFELKVKTILSTSPCCDVCVYFRMLLFFVTDIRIDP